MMQTKDVRDYIAALAITADENCYSGILPDKPLCSIGAYPLRLPPDAPAVGLDKSYHLKGASVLVHWNKNMVESESAAFSLYEALKSTTNATVNGYTIKRIEMKTDEPIWVGHDESGIVEFVIECVLWIDQ